MRQICFQIFVSANSYDKRTGSFVFHEQPPDISACASQICVHIIKPQQTKKPPRDHAFECPSGQRNHALFRKLSLRCFRSKTIGFKQAIGSKSRSVGRPLCQVKIACYTVPILLLSRSDWIPPWRTRYHSDPVCSSTRGSSTRCSRTAESSGLLNRRRQKLTTTNSPRLKVGFELRQLIELSLLHWQRASHMCTVLVRTTNVYRSHAISRRLIHPFGLFCRSVCVPTFLLFSFEPADLCSRREFIYITLLKLSNVPDEVWMTVTFSRILIKVPGHLFNKIALLSPS